MEMVMHMYGVTFSVTISFCLRFLCVLFAARIFLFLEYFYYRINIHQFLCFNLYLISQKTYESYLKFFKFYTDRNINLIILFYINNQSNWKGN